MTNWKKVIVEPHPGSTLTMYSAHAKNVRPKEIASLVTEAERLGQAADHHQQQGEDDGAQMIFLLSGE